MLRKRILLSLLLFTVADASIAENLECTYEKRFKDSGSKGADLKIKIDDKRITQLSVSSSFASGEEAGGYVCEIDTSEQNRTVQWKVDSKKTLLQITFDGARPSNIEIEPTAKGYRVNLEGASLDACGFGAAWPKSIEASRGSKKCQVIYDNY